MLRPRCCNGVATTDYNIMQKATISWPENMVTLSRQGCRVPSSVRCYIFYRDLHEYAINLPYN